MKKPPTCLIIIILLLLFIKCSARLAVDEIVFYSNGSVFAPVVVIEGNAQILWTWDDRTTSTSAMPRKDYATQQLRKNILKVTPWSAVRRINIGYDAQDGGSPEIEIVANQFVSKVENLQLVAPYLRVWCSSYNLLTSLDFSNFVNLETIECFFSQTLQSVMLTNTPHLTRACFVVNALQSLDMSGCHSLKEVLVGLNQVTNILLPEYADSLWYLGARENHQIINHYIYSDLSKYPNISHLSIWNSNQKGELRIPKTDPKKWIWIRGYENEYTILDLRGSLQNSHEIGYVDMHKNKLTKVEIDGCCQIKTLDLSDNLLSIAMIDSVLMQMDEFGNAVVERQANLSLNSPPSDLGLKYKKNLEAKGWNVIVDKPLLSNNLIESEDFTIFPNPSHGIFKLHLNKIPREGITVQITNIKGQLLLSRKIYNVDSEWSIDQYPGNIFCVTLKSNHNLQTKRISKI